MSTENPFQYEDCPQCGLPYYYQDKKTKRHVCTNQECGYTVDDEESIWSKLLRMLRIKK